MRPTTGKGVAPGYGDAQPFALPSRAPIDVSDRDRRRSLMFATARKSQPRLRRLRGIHYDRPVGLSDPAPVRSSRVLGD
jgi:hypothetical protein